MENIHCAIPGSELKNSGFYYTLSIIGGKYKITIIYLLAEHETLRHNALQRYIQTISFKTLSTMLKELINDGIISRKEYPQIPPKVEYTLTAKGKSLIPVLNMMCDWGERHRKIS